MGKIKIIDNGKLHSSYNEEVAAQYMKGENIEINVETYTGLKNFKTHGSYKKYIEINADYRS